MFMIIKISSISVQHDCHVNVLKQTTISLKTKA